MKAEYDFSKAEKGKFYKAGVKLNVPIYLDQEVREHYEKIAKKNNQEIHIIINDILRKNIGL